MKLEGQLINHLNSVTHDGKVLVFGTSASGVIYYSVQRSGFEDTAVATGADPFGFESWRALSLGDSTDDVSVREYEKKNLVDDTNKPILRSVYGNIDEVTKSAAAAVQLVSALGHLWVFRQSSTSKCLLVNRFVLDGMKNELVPKLEVRFARSKQRLTAHQPKNAKESNQKQTYDVVDFRDVDGNNFFEPALELSFAGIAKDGWFCPVFVHTSEEDRYRWHIFVCDAQNCLSIYTIGANADGMFDVKDYLYAKPDAADSESFIYRSIPGIIQTKLNLSGLTISGAPSVTTYDLQREQITDVGPQLMRDATRVMVAFPVRSNDKTNTAVLDFALCADGTLAQLDPTAGRSTILRSDEREVVMPLSLLDEIKAFAQDTPSSQGTIVATERGAEDLLRVRSVEELGQTLAPGVRVQLRGTQSYDGHYKVIGVNGDTFEVKATFKNGVAGRWEEEPVTQTGLVFDDMIVGTRKTASDTLEILCPAHDLAVNDEVQISGTCEYDGVYPVVSVDGANKAFVLNAPYFTGEAANLRKVNRRGMNMGKTGRVETPNLKLALPNPQKNLERTISAWIYADKNGNAGQGLLEDDNAMISLVVGADNKVALNVRLDDASIQTIKDPDPLPPKTWTHYAGSMRYIPGQGVSMSLYRNGLSVSIPQSPSISPSRYPQGTKTAVGTETKYVIGRGFAGTIADAQVWSVARSAARVKATMFLQPTGQERGLEVCYRLGAITYEGETPTVPDFSTYGRHGRVLGDAYAGARELPRKTKSNQKVIKYSNDELVTVSPRGLYEETFEFKVDTTDTTFDPNTVDGQKLFVFSYWGKSSRGSKEIISFQGQPYDFQKIDDWYLAKCRFVVPDDVTLLRGFEIVKVQGLWKNETNPPAKEWTSLHIRKHHIRLISDTISRDEYSKTQTLSVLTSQSADVSEKLTALEKSEVEVAQYEDEIADLLIRLDIVRNNAAHVAEKDTLEKTTIPAITARIDVLRAEIKTITDDPYSYWHYLRVKHNNYYIYASADFSVAQWRVIDSDKVAYQWRIKANGDGTHTIFSAKLGGAIGIPGNFGPDGLGLKISPYDTSRADQKWRFYETGGAWRKICNVQKTDRYMDVYKESRWDGEKVIHYAANNKTNQQFSLKQLDKMTTEASDELARKENELDACLQELVAANERLATLSVLLDAKENQATLLELYKTASTNLDNARQGMASKNTAVVNALKASPANPVKMKDLATDAKGLVTRGAVLQFAQPLFDVRLMESSNGHVLLTYLDNDLRMRVTAYDAVDDRRNTAFEQWLPEATRSCAYLGDSGDKITLNQAVELPPTAWSCEAWVHYPLATQKVVNGTDQTTNGSAYKMNVVFAMANPTGKPLTDAPLVIRDGQRLGVIMDGWFFDSGVSLDKVLTNGWHHLAVTRNANDLTFHADGVNIANRSIYQPALRFNGATDYVEVPAHTSPSAGLTISIWMRGADAKWARAGGVVCKRSQFMIFLENSTVEFCIWVKPTSGQTEQKSLIVTPPNIVGWHLYTATYDGNYMRLYVDGKLVATGAHPGSVDPSTGDKMYLGYDNADFRKTFFKGDIAEVAYWNYARGPSDILEDVYRSLKGNETGLIGLWRMESVQNGDKLQVLDASPSARHGTIVGKPVDVPMTAFSDANVKYLGNASAGGSPVGRLAEARIWSIPLSDREIAANARVFLSGAEPGLIGYWPLDELLLNGTVNDRSFDGRADGVPHQVDIAGCTAKVGRTKTFRVDSIIPAPEPFGPFVLHLPYTPQRPGYLRIPGGSSVLSNSQFTFEGWVCRSAEGFGKTQCIAQQAVSGLTGVSRFKLGFDTNNQLFMEIHSTRAVSDTAIVDTTWHHVCAVFSSAEKMEYLYCDGKLVGSKLLATVPSSSDQLDSYIRIGSAMTSDGPVESLFGNIAEVRIWNTKRTEAEIRANMNKVLVGNETSLVANYPLNQVQSGKVYEKKTNGFKGDLEGIGSISVASVLEIVDSPAIRGLIAAEYSTVQLGSDGNTQAIMRRFYAYPTSAGEVQLIPEQRLEELTLQWVGNTQIKPTLLGYIEGAPPVPSENLTESEDGYKGATSVTLSQSEDTTYSWQRTETSSFTNKTELFLGAAWEVEANTLFISSKLSEGEAGGVGNFNYEAKSDQGSTISAASSLQMSDSLSLVGQFEKKPRSEALGRRWLPKNVGYALVISGTADVFVTKLRRSGRMVNYEIKPVPGIPLDVNTITFLMNPAYTLNGTLDGMVGSMAADPVFYEHVPEMRAHYGAMYPASYFRVEQAYALKEAIDRQDKARESFFYNFDASQISTINDYDGADSVMLPQTAPPTVVGDMTQDDMSAMLAASEEQKKQLEAEALKRQEEINAKTGSLDNRMRANAGFAKWQMDMQSIQIKAGKRNIVNTYVWDGDGGLRAEEQNFAGTIEHSLGNETSYSGDGGANTETAIVGFKFKVSLLFGGSSVSAMSKTLNLGHALQLNVDLSGVESDGITDLYDTPLKPGEKVDRYRFMSFYLEGNTSHFTDFFRDVVAPTWLQSNDEEARTLREAMAKPNKCWRVLHRVTYVERPALKNFGS